MAGRVVDSVVVEELTNAKAGQVDDPFRILVRQSESLYAKAGRSDRGYAWTGSLARRTLPSL